MKMLKVVLIMLCLSCAVLASGCGDKQLPSAKITRDEARVGGSLSFVFDQNDGVVYVGGKDEYLSYTTGDESKGYAEGNRVGLKVTAPDVELDLENAVLEMNDVTYSAGDFLESVNGENQRFFYIYPSFDKKNNEVSFSITWQEGTKAQEYRVIVVEGTKFLNQNGEII